MEIRESRKEDRTAILGLVRSVFGNEVAEMHRREWTWQWHDDPRLPQPGYRGLVVEDGGTIVGSTALQPAGLHVDGRPVPSWWQVNTVVHKDFRRRGIAALLNDRMPPGAILAKAPSAAMLEVFRKCGYDEIETGGYWRRNLTYAPRMSWLGAESTMLGTLADMTLRRLPPMPPDVKLHRGVFDARFDALWSEARAAYPAITRRDAATLTWRYRRRPGATYRVLVHGEGAGYIVFTTLKRRGSLRGRIVDVLTRPTDDTARTELLVGALHTLKEAGADRVDAWASSAAVQAALRPLGFRPSTGKDALLVRGAAARDLYITAGDGDGG